MNTNMDTALTRESRCVCVCVCASVCVFLPSVLQLLRFMHVLLKVLLGCAWNCCEFDRTGKVLTSTPVSLPLCRCTRGSVATRAQLSFPSSLHARGSSLTADKSFSSAPCKPQSARTSAAVLLGNSDNFKLEKQNKLHRRITWCYLYLS